jgi:asparagine synthase (glutamine-hydrolysing)
MCGISGIFDPRATADDTLAALRRMTTVLAHRGPDADGFHVEPGVGLGHRRLSIIDVAGGDQPIYGDGGRLAIVFNGEIYNFVALRRELEALGHRFATRSDTEVILRGYEAWGDACVERLRGMFAFAIWDRARRRLLLARDRIGVKPLYYAWNGSRLLFASEIKGILAHPAASTRLDREALDDYLTYLYVPAPKSIYAGIRKLRPGHLLIVSEDGITERPYWALRFEPDERASETEHAERLAAALEESVRLHLVSDVPLGAFLSGGLDSTAVVALMARAMDRPVETASIGFRDAQFDELPYARAAARALGTNAHEAVVDADAVRILDILAWHFDEPFADSSMVPTYYVSEVARRHVTVCLSGDGGDENFAGYRRYRFDLLENRIRSLVPAGVGTPLFGTLGRLYPKADWLPRPLRGRTLLTNLGSTPERAYFRTMSWFDAEMKDRLYGADLKASLAGYDSFGVLGEHFEQVPDLDPLSRIQYVDFKTYLPDDILTKVDRTSMAHSLEVRVPILDHVVVEAAARIPADLKLRDGEGKWIFKRAVGHLLPREVLDRPKMGFSVPLAAWFRGGLKHVFETRVLGGASPLESLFDLAPVAEWWGQHQRGTRDYAYHLWSLLMLDAWARRAGGVRL